MSVAVQVRIRYNRGRIMTTYEQATPGQTLRQFYLDVLLPLLRKSYYMINELECDRDHLIAYQSWRWQTDLFNYNSEMTGQMIDENWVFPMRYGVCLQFNLAYDHLSTDAKKLKTVTHAEYKLCVPKEAHIANQVIWTLIKAGLTSWLI
jgi:hypothetical protein